MTEILMPLKTTGPWIGFDLDGTLAVHGKYAGPTLIGTMIERMKEIIIEWINQGYRVKIVTARMSHEKTRDASQEAIQDWLEDNGLPRMECTCEKDYKMLRLYDDRAVQVIPNTGVTLEEVVATLQAENATLMERMERIESDAQDRDR